MIICPMSSFLFTVFSTSGISWYIRVVCERRLTKISDDPNKDGATVLSRLQLPYVISQGYVSLRCAWAIGCPNGIYPTAAQPRFETEAVFREAFLELFPERALRDGIPEIVGAGCCAQMAVSSAKVRELPKAEYIRIRDWLMNTPRVDYISGRIMEYSWHCSFSLVTFYPFNYTH